MEINKAAVVAELSELFDPLVRRRLFAGALTPAAWVNFAQRFRSWFRAQMAQGV